MWIFMSEAFLSIVEDPERPSFLLVRARAKGDIERVFPGRRGRELKAHDYAFRAWIPRDVVANTIASNVRKIGYSNFKDSVTDDARHGAYLDVWRRMHAFQSLVARR